MNKEIETSLKILNSVYFNKAYASIELNKFFHNDSLKNNGSNNINYNVITKIVYGVIDSDVRLEYYLSQFFKKQPKKDVLLIFKIGSYIHFNIDSIPDYALVNELVEIVKHSKFRPYQSFINAVLKKIIVTDFVEPKKDNFDLYLSVKYSKPMWFISLLRKNFDNGFIEDFLEYMSSTDTHIRVNTINISVDKFLSKLNEFNIGHSKSVFDDAMYVDYSSLVKYSSLNNLYTVQGIPSMIVARNLCGNNVLDACSAPGGKSIYFATLNRNAKVLACDIYEHRLQLIETYKTRLDVNNVETRIQDGSVENSEFIDKFDCVLVDVPCSGLGVVDKKPDILLNNQLKYDQLPPLQLKILENNAKYVKVGGSIVYSTCTILHEENEDIVNEFLKKHKNFKIVPVETFGVNAVDTKGMKTFYPHISHTEGFFIGKLERYE